MPPRSLSTLKPGLSKSRVFCVGVPLRALEPRIRAVEARRYEENDEAGGDAWRLARPPKLRIRQEQSE